MAGWVVLEGTCRGQWERRGRLLAPDLQRQLHGIALRKATAFDVFPSSSLIFVLYCESWVREEAGASWERLLRLMFYQQFPFLCVVMQELSGWLGGLSSERPLRFMFSPAAPSYLCCTVKAG